MIRSHQRLLPVFFVFIVLLLITGCRSGDPGHWSEFVPGETPFLIVPQENTGLSEALSANYMPLFDDLTPSAVQMISSLTAENQYQITVNALLLYPETSNNWQPVWVTTPREAVMEGLTGRYQQPFNQNRYHFNGYTIEKLLISDRTVFALELSPYLIFSESSLSLEAILRTLNGQNSAVKLEADQIEPGRFIINMESVEHWVQQVAQVSYRPYLLDLFDGAGPLSLSFSTPEEEEGESLNWQLTGEMVVDSIGSTPLRAISSISEEFTLDRYISVNTSGFSILRLEPRAVPITGLDAANETDRYIRDNPEIWSLIASQLESELAFATFAESGASSSSEYMFYRKTSGNASIRDALNRLEQEGLAVRDGNTYQVNSRWLSILFGSELSAMSDFYVTLYRDVAALSLRKGLSQSVIPDAQRRRVVYYDDDYIEIREALPDNLSFVFYLNTPRFIRYIQPWLNPQHNINTLLSELDQFVISGERSSTEQPLSVTFSSFELQDSEQPYRENWIFPLQGSELTGKPVLANITAGERNEIVFSTLDGQVIALAADGTSVLEVSTGGDEPTGSPVVYDWYGNNQRVVMQAAGNRIYAWNSNGNLLPNFPVSLAENITTPLTVMDVTRNGVAEIIVGTSDRRIHILNSRGAPLEGWPQSTNTVVNGSPLITEIEDEWSLFTFAENTLHAWNINSARRQGFPVFLPTQMAGNPARYNNTILGSGLDGNLYSVGLQPFFSDSLASSHNTDSLQVQSVQITNSSLNSTPQVHSILLRDEEEGFIREDLILVQSANGSLFLYNSEGVLRFTASMAQPASSSTPPMISDLDMNGRQDLVAVADFGRMYAWDLLSGERLFDLPTTGMSHIVISDISEDGQHELIAETRDGLRSWTIIQTRRESMLESSTAAEEENE
ncbi:hypothetical protein [Rhodohalobacter mucosus]|uniref:Uncharacterized protein n=1 Tax=Rhodohalobacter mucosus TaxID=2079485 RepID=A0A316TZ07_9BACT|nr:hypothetical protein [Rhodohalobacter mucosus]PWN08152.1 hypothetical protein DDZ15_00515 [Rhodohalobacter mucosus]